MVLFFEKIHPKAIIPKYQTRGSAGFDFHAIADETNKRFRENITLAVKDDSDNYVNKHFKNVIIIPTKSQSVIRTGLIAKVPQEYEMQIRPRSGLAVKKQITITNSPGTVDSGFLGELMIIIFNLGNEPFIIETGDRIAQGIINKIEQAQIIETTDIPEKFKEEDRGGGLGSTGVK